MNKLFKGVNNLLKYQEFKKEKKETRSFSKVSNCYYDKNTSNNSHNGSQY